MTQIGRKWIRDLLLRWQNGELNERLVHEKAEALWETLEERADFPENDPRSIPLEVLAHLEILNQQLITRDDIPAILTFLDTRLGEEDTGWHKWKRYWEELDLTTRIESLRDNSYYSAHQVHRRRQPGSSRK